MKQPIFKYAEICSYHPNTAYAYYIWMKDDIDGTQTGYLLRNNLIHFSCGPVGFYNSYRDAVRKLKEVFIATKVRKRTMCPQFKIKPKNNVIYCSETLLRRYGDARPNNDNRDSIDS